MTTNDDSIPPLDPADWRAFREFAHTVVDETLEHVRTIRDTRAWNTMPQRVRDAISNEPLPRTGIGVETEAEMMHPGQVLPVVRRSVPGHGRILGG